MCRWRLKRAPEGPTGQGGPARPFQRRVWCGFKSTSVESGRRQRVAVLYPALPVCRFVQQTRREASWVGSDGLVASVTA